MQQHDYMQSSLTAELRESDTFQIMVWDTVSDDTNILF